MALFETTFPPYVAFGSRTLSQGNAGSDVAVIQSVYNLMLQTMNPPEGPMGSPITLTGTYDAATVQAVRNIQSFFGLSTDGIAGPATYFVFGQGVGANTTYGGPVYGSRELRQGNAGGDVTVLQNRLNCFRYASLIGKPATGTFDAATSTAVLAFKQDAAANGDTGFPDNAVAGSGFYAATWIYTFAGGRGIFPDRNGFDVVFVQVLLGRLGFYTGRVHGYYDAATQAAVTAYQRARGISADGIVGQETFYHFGLNNAVAAPQPLQLAWPVTPTPTLCSVALEPTTSAPSAFGSASLLGVSAGAVNIVGNNLPDPSTFYAGGSYSYHVVTCSGTVLAQGLMTSIGGSVWAGSASINVTSARSATVTVRANPAGAVVSTGPIVLTANFSTCR